MTSKRKRKQLSNSFSTGGGGQHFEAAGFHRFAVTMRSLAETYTREAERIRKGHSFEEAEEADANDTK